MGSGQNGEAAALLDTTGRQVITDILSEGVPDAAAMGLVTEEYTANTIRLLEGVEHVRTRPAMYIGDTGSSGLHHLLFEIVDNSIDEVLAGHATEIWVTLNPDKTVTVRDNGRGIPADLNEATGLSGVELALTKLNAGGKFGGGGYKVSGGLHGVGLSCVNFLSEWCEAVVEQKGKEIQVPLRARIAQAQRPERDRARRTGMARRLPGWPTRKSSANMPISPTFLSRASATPVT